MNSNLHDRREFLKTSAAIGAVAALGPLATGGKAFAAGSDQIGVGLPDLIETFAAVGRGRHFISVVAQQRGQVFDRVPVVVNDQNVFGHPLTPLSLSDRQLEGKRGMLPLVPAPIPQKSDRHEARRSEPSRPAPVPYLALSWC